MNHSCLSKVEKDYMPLYLYQLQLCYFDAAPWLTISIFIEIKSMPLLKQEVASAEPKLIYKLRSMAATMSFAHVMGGRNFQVILHFYFTHKPT